MSYNISFMELARRGKELLQRQQPVTLEEAREQARRVKEMSQSKHKKY